MNRVRAFWAIVVGILREIADERAYASHLTECGAPPSAEEWRRFSEHRFRAKYSRAKCC